jgi:predicted SAM-dependent methyltransferase
LSITSEPVTRAPAVVAAPKRGTGRAIRYLLHAFFHTWIGYKLISFFISCTQYRVFRSFTVHSMRLDSLRLRARIAAPRVRIAPPLPRLHVGSGDRHVPGWTNVDVFGTDPLVDLGAGVLPWHDRVFDAIASQHVIEHLELHSELIPLLRELRRVARPGAEIWLSCPDMEIICRAYFEDRAAALVADRIRTATVETGLNGIPPQHFINKIFVQEGEHQNLFDLELLDWTLKQAGFADCRRVSPNEFHARFPEFPAHYADLLSIYVRAEAPGTAAERESARRAQEEK